MISEQNPTLTVKGATADKIECIVENPTRYNLYMGQEFRLFTTVNGELNEIDLSNEPITLEVYGIEPGDSLEFTVPLSFELSPGAYMITKSVSVNGMESATLAGTFRL